jgi:DNA-binding transcriptional ArsR family regulator
LLGAVVVVFVVCLAWAVGVFDVPLWVPPLVGAVGWGGVRVFISGGFCMFVESVEVRRRIVEFLRGRGGASVYQIAKELGISYGSAQWHLYVLEREGVVFTVLQGRRRVVVLRDSFDAYVGSLRVMDFFRDLWEFLRSRGVEGSTPFLEAVRSLGEGDVSSSLVSIAKSLYYWRRGEEGGGQSL